MIIAVIVVHYYFFLIKKELKKADFQLIYLFMHGNALFDFKKMVKNEKDPKKRRKYNRLRFMFKVSTWYLITVVLICIAIELLG